MKWMKSVGKQQVQLLLLCLLLIAGAASLPAQTLAAGTGGFDQYDQITRSPIPVNTAGCSDMGVLLIGLSATGGDVYIGQVDIALNGTDTLGTSRISDVKLYFNTENKYNTALPAGTWTAINSSFTVGASTITVTTTDLNAVIPNGADRRLWIAFDYAATTLIDTPAQVSYYIDTIHYGDSDGGTAGIQYGNTFDPAGSFPSDPTRIDPINDYYVAVSGAGAVASPSENQGENDVVVLSLAFSGTVDDEAQTKEIASITVQSVGDRDADIGSPGVRLHWDTNIIGTFEPGTDPQVAEGMLSGGQAVLTTSLADADAQFDENAKQYWLVVNVDLNATVGNTIGLEITNPSTDITFRDAYPDPGTWQTGGYEQTGYITTSSITWTTNTFTVTPAPDMNPPQVLATVPLSGGTDVEPDTTISIVFSQYMLNDATANGVLNSANYELRDIVNDTTVSVAPTYDSSAQTATLTPASALDWATPYRLTVFGNLQDIDGQTIADYYTVDGYFDFTFTTRPEFPVVSSPTAIKNRIGTGANSETVILIPTPPSGSFAGLSVQVFTTTGRLVKTFRGAEIETIANGRKIAWNGTNDRGDNLGPGMYFVQVRLAGKKHVLKVMIVR
jgi:hypothetical protein